MSSLGVKAAPLNYKTIETIAVAIRQKLEITGEFPANTLEHILQGFFGDTCPLGIKDNINQEGLTLLDGSGIYLKSNVYEDLTVHNEARARFTAMHELAHRILHCNQFANIAHCRGKIETFCDPEWQADALAGAILCPAHEIKSKVEMSVDDVMTKYRVSRPCAEKRLKVIKEKF
jgi:Zn-dependent peptidase ImmA (M78 family)